MAREYRRNSFFGFIVIVMVIVILAVAFTASAQGTGGGQGRMQPSALPEQVDAQQPTITPLVVSSPRTSEVRSDIITSSPLTSAPVFMRRAVYDSGGSLTQLAASADLNNDGKPDLAVVNYSTYGNGSVGVLVGKGNGTFWPVVVYDSGGGAPNGVAIGDLNGDGSPDLVVANQGCPGVDSFCLGVLLGNGDGTFQAVVIYASGGWSWAGGPTPIMISDVNGDTKPDLVVVSQTDRNYGPGFLSVLLGNGDGTFRAVATYDSGGFAAFSGALADVNGDGKVDAVLGSCTTSGSTDCFSKEAVVGVLLGNGDGTFQAARKYGTGGVGGFWLPLVVADLNNDHKADILVGNSCLKSGCSANHGTLGVLIGNGDGTFQSARTYDPGRGGIFSIAIADLNGDGNLDAVVGEPLGVFLGKGDGTFQPFLAVPSARGAGQVIAADLNHDKKTDLAALWGPNNSADVFLGNGDGTFQEAQAYKFLGFGSSRLTIADVNVDGKPDLVAASMSRTQSSPYEGSVSVLLNVFTDTTTTTLSSSLNPSIYGQKVTWRARVTTSGSIPPTGRVIFRTSGDGQNKEIGAAGLDASGVATLTRSTLNVPMGGPYPLVAVYLGDIMNSRSQSDLVLQDVRQTTSVATITSSRNPSSRGQTVTFTAKISSPTITVTGPVTFTAGNTVLGTAQLSRGTATFTTSALPMGSITVTVIHPWNSNVNKSSASLVQTVQ